jgi:hypothetical protein
VPNRPPEPPGSARESDQIAAFRFLEGIVTNDRAGLLQGSKQYPHSGPDRCRSARASPTGYQTHDAAAAGTGLSPEESLGVGRRLEDSLAMKIEDCIGGSVGPVEHHNILDRIQDFVQIGSMW